MPTQPEFYKTLLANEFNFFTGVPDSTLKGVFRCLAEDPDATYVTSTGEYVAIGVATGAALAGKRVCVLMQNSGFGTAINGLASLPMLYKLQMLLIVGWRGYKGKDSAEHTVMGRSTSKLMDALELPYVIAEPDTLEMDLKTSIQNMERTNSPSALLIHPGVFQK